MGKASRVKTRDKPKTGPYVRIERVSEQSCPGTPRVTVLGSDKKQRAPVLGICALCREEAVLLLSHIIPRWAYQWMREEGCIHRPGRSGVVTHIQDGTKHYLLCRDCEQYLGVAENYLRLVCAGTARELKAEHVSLCHHGHCAMHLKGIQENLLRRGLLGILFKEHFALSSDIRIRSDIALERLRLSLKGDDYSRYRSCIAFKWVGLDHGNPRNAAGCASALTLDGTVSVILIIGGMEWWLFPSGTPHLLDAPLSLSEPWAVFVADSSTRDAGTYRWKGMNCNQSDPWADVALSDNCPCGNARTFIECCRTTWCSWPGMDIGA